jgi:LuxR family maltose regulon positive regulatory protein
VTEAQPDVAPRPPLERRGMVRRSGLLARFDRTPDAAVLLVAPGGYGKTTVLTQWAASAATVAWVTTGADDNDPGYLAQHIALALLAAFPVEAEEVGLSDRLRARRRLEPSDVLKAFGALRRIDRSAVLVVDDLHEIQGRASLALVRALFEESSATLRVAAATRTYPDLGLSALVADNRCLQVGPAGLAFSQEEARQVFVAARQAAPPDVVRTVVERTEGWPAGVYLAALVARQERRGEPAAVRPGVISGDDLYIADYFRDELLAGEPADNVRFLLRTSVLERMSGPLCDAMLETTGSAPRLAEAERRNLFVVPLDGEGTWYRYHRLFGEMLVAELRRREPGEEFSLHRRAAAWFEREGRLEEAIAHALAGADTARAARLVDLRARQTFAAGRRITVLGWLRQLDDAALAAYPPLAVTAGWIWALSGHPIQAQSALRVARAADPAGPLPDGSSSLESATALLAAFLAPLGVERMAEDARRAVELEPAGSPQRPVALAVLGAAHVLAGRPELAGPVLAEAVELGLTFQKRTAAFAHAELATLALAAGKDRADADIAASLALLADAGLEHDFEAMLAYAAAAWSAARAGDVPTVRRYVGAVQRIGADTSPEAVPWYGAHVNIVLARAALEAGDPLAARARIEEARQYLGHLLTEGVLRDEVEELADLLARTRSTSGLPSSMALTAAEVRVLRLLPTHLSLGEIAEELGVSRNTIKTQVAATYRKLQASTRAEAVQRGRELGLLEGDDEPDARPEVR